MRYMRKTIIWMMLLVFSSGAVFAQKAERKHGVLDCYSP